MVNLSESYTQLWKVNTTGLTPVSGWQVEASTTQYV